MGTTKIKKKPVLPAEPAVTGSQADYDRFIGAALALDPKQIIPCRADASLAHANVTLGLASLLAREGEARKLPKIDVDALELLPNKCLAVAFATTQIADGSSGVIAIKLTRASALRRKLFLAADALADAGIFPAEKVKALHAGSGKIDSASDCVGLAALFQKHAAQAKGKHAVTAAEVTEAAAVGSDLLKLLKPSTAKKTRSDDAKQAADARDRLWTLVKQGHEALWRACAFLYGPDEIDAKVPALQARVATTSNRKKANAAKRAEKAKAKPVPAAGG